MSAATMMQQQQQHQSNNKAGPRYGGYHSCSAADAFCSVPRQQLQQQQLSSSSKTGGPAHAHVAPQPAAGAARQHDMQQLLNMLMSKVITLTAEKQQLAAKCSGLKQENEQLTDLVMVMSDTMKQQQQHAKVLLHLASSHSGSQAGSPKAAPGSSSGAGFGRGGAAAAGPGQATAAPPRSHSEPSAATPARRASGVAAKPPLRTVSLPLELPAADDDTEAVVSCTLPSPGSEQQAVEPALVDTARMRSRQQRVAEWLQTKPTDWKEWQSCLPLETTTSSSSSSLQLALDDALAQPDTPLAVPVGAA